MLLLLAAALAAPAAAPVTTPTAWTAPPLLMCDDTRLLVTYDYEYIQTHICDLCGKTEPERCVMDWPVNDVPECGYFDELRNNIYAYYGRPFETPKWHDWFAKVPWYKVNPNYTDTLLSAEARHNVATLKSIVAKAQVCTK